MSVFFANLVDLILTAINAVISTIQNIVDFVSSAMVSISSLMTYSTEGMNSIRSIIECLPSPLFTVISGCICVLLLIAVLRIFI